MRLTTESAVRCSDSVIHSLVLIEELRDHDEPRQQGHDQQDDECRSRDQVALRNQRTKAKRIINGSLLH
jgi:hypothetical protein